MIDAQIEALAAGTRRRIYGMLLKRPHSVREIAEKLPVSRPAVSQHLKVLTDAGLAAAVSVGTRRVYSADPAGLAELRAWTEQLWTSALGGFADLVATNDEEDAMTARQTLKPVVKSLYLRVPPAAAFEMFTGRIAEWWPLTTHSVALAEAAGVRMESGVGGRIVETAANGTEHEWGLITVWEEGRRVEFTWRPGLARDQETLVEVRFRETRDGCEMILIHTGWEARGEIATEVRDGYDSGWDLVLSRYMAGLA